MNNYQVADFITRIKNASLARRKEIITFPYKINKAIGKVLVKEGFLKELTEKKVDGRDMLVVVIRYEKRRPVLNNVLLISKPSLRVYTEVKDIAALRRRGRHTVVLSTNKGIMTDKDANKHGVGGEVLFKIW